MAATFAIANSTHHVSTERLRSQAIADMADRLDRGIRAQLPAQPADADVDDVRTRIEAVAPDVGEQPLAADHLPRVEHEVMEQAELPVGEIVLRLVEPCLATGEVEDES